MSTQLTPEKGLIFRITHIRNLPWIVENGLHCRSSDCVDENFVQIGNLELIDRRQRINVPVPPHGMLSDYIPFYFTPFSVMLLNIITGFNGIERVDKSDIVILVTSVGRLVRSGVAVLHTDRHAALATAQFYTGDGNLGEIDWGILQRRDFRRNDDDPDKMARYQAEALVYRHLPFENLAGIVCYSANEERTIQAQLGEAASQVRVLAKPSWYFE